MEVYKTKSDKVDVVVNFLMNGPPCGWLFLMGMSGGGEGKSMATNEAIEICKNSFGEESIVRLPCNNDSNAYKLVLMKKDSTIVKTIVHVNAWNPHWEFMASEWDAQVARFERSDL